MEHTVWRGRGNDDQIDVAGIDIGCGNGALRGLDREVTGEFAFCRNVPLTYAGPGDDPLIRGIHHFFQVGVGQDFLRQVATGSCNT
jgi:hypothetical protein